MNLRLIRTLAFTALVALVSLPAAAQQAGTKPFEPTVGQPGKDVVWVPTPQALVDKMLDMAKVTPQDYLIDLGSGDGRTVITAAKRGLRAHGIEYNPDMVELAKRNATTAGVANRATFAKADIFESDFTKAQVITLFLLPSLNVKLRPTLLNMKPGTRVVSNSFTMAEWQPDETATLPGGEGGCEQWCTAYLWIVPAKVEGTWQTPQGPLVLTQMFQMVNGTLGGKPISEGKLNGEDLSFNLGTMKYTAKVDGNSLKGGNLTGSRR